MPEIYTLLHEYISFIFVTGTSQGGPGSQMCLEVAIVNDELFLIVANSPNNDTWSSFYYCK